jgi:uncharacterized damage-inducible protein DinB
MHIVTYIQNTYQWNSQANSRIIDAIATSGTDGGAVELLSHLLMAEHIWFLRIEGFDTRTRDVWPLLSLHECRERYRENASIADAWLEKATPADIQRQVDYRNSKGEAFSSTVADILLHITHHSAYHRAQINLQLKSAGTPPAVVDYISFARGEWGQ